jgi:oligogalacturonide lyase
MAKGTRYPSESRRFTDPRTGVAIRQVTDNPAINHQPFFFVQAYDNAMRWLFFVSHRTGAPRIFAEERSTGDLVQLTDRPDLDEWSVRPSFGGHAIFFTASARGWRLDTATLEERELADFTATSVTDQSAVEGTKVGEAMGTTGLSYDDRWWAVSYKVGAESVLSIVDTEAGGHKIILRRDSIGHMQFCPDDPNLLFYAGPLTDRVWVIGRDGAGNRRVYRRAAGEWITHESWIPGTRELAFVDWPHGIRCVQVDTGVERRVTSFNAWHAICNRQGTLMVADTNFPDIGLQIFDPRDGIGQPRILCYPESSSLGAHWNGPFPYEQGPIKVYAPQHTHPHPSFSPDGQFVVYTSDRTGHSQVYEADTRM